MSIFTSHKERPIYNALIGLSWGIGCIVGPAIGGGFTSSNATWRWAFYINLPLTACFTPIYLFQFPSFNPRPDIPVYTKITQIDWVGAVLNALVFTLFQIALTLSGSTWRWASPGTVVLWAVFGICLVAYVLQQVCCIFTTPEHRLFPIQFLRHRASCIAVRCNILHCHHHIPHHLLCSSVLPIHQGRTATHALSVSCLSLL